MTERNHYAPGQQPRSVKRFPNMKVRGKRNRKLERYVRMLGKFDRLSNALEFATVQMQGMADPLRELAKNGLVSFEDDEGTES